MADLSIQNAFIEGINEVYYLMFTDRVKMYLWNPDANVSDDVYAEEFVKHYFEPIEIVAKVQMFTLESERYIEKANVGYTITVPVKQFLVNNIPFYNDSDLRYIEKSMFEYNGLKMVSNRVNPKTLVADIWQFFDFQCYGMKPDVIRKVPYENQDLSKEDNPDDEVKVEKPIINIIPREDDDIYGS